MSVLQHFAQQEYESLDETVEITQNDADDIISTENVVENDKFRLGYIYANLLQSPKCDGIQPKGFRSTVRLYGYQKRSLKRMIERETKPETFMDPTWEKQDTNGETTYKNLVTGTKREEYPGFYEDDRGGILCENMGTGKTAICIGLILHTRGLKPNPHNASPFAAIPPCALPSADQTSPVRSLKQLCALQIVNTRSYSHIDNLPLELKDYLDSIPTPHILVQDQSHSSPRKAPPPPKHIFTSHCTLVIVPPALVDQWIQEIYKFVDDGQLNVLICHKASDLTTAEDIARNYDIVLLSHNVLRISDKPSKIVDNSSEECIKALKQVYWMRVIVDEGHIMGVETTNQTQFASTLFVERNWVCTGTPTPNHLANNIDQEMKYLHGLLSFVKQKPWENNKTWNKLISQPFKKKDEKALILLSSLLNRVMIRNKAEDIQRDVDLPPCHVNVTKLKFKDGEALRYNQLVAQIRGNLITSRYEGKNSLFDASNRKYAFQSLARLREACFYYTGLNEEERDLCADEVEKDLNFADPTKTPLSSEEEENLKTIYSFMQVDAWISPSEPILVEESAKLSYLLARLEEIPKDEKIIIFTQFNDTLRRLLDTFDNLQIPFLEFHTKMTTAKRSSTVTTFNTSSDARVILMKTELAAYGINLTAASRIFMMDPVWDLSREAQAIKRAHRIGQTKEVYVEKLVIEGTIEDQLFQDFNQPSDKKASENLRKIRALLQNLTFNKIDFEIVKEKYQELRAAQQLAKQRKEEELKLLQEIKAEMPGLEPLATPVVAIKQEEDTMEVDSQRLKRENSQSSPNTEPVQKKKKAVTFAM